MEISRLNCFKTDCLRVLWLEWSLIEDGLVSSLLFSFVGDLWVSRVI